MRKKKYVNVVFSNEDHAFFCDERPAYDPNAARQWWALSIDIGGSSVVSAIWAPLTATWLAIACFGWQSAPQGGRVSSPTFYKDVLPILQDHCQSCHRKGEVAPMPLESYQETRPWAKAMAHAVQMRMMPPWFADPHYGRFANDTSLTDQQIAIMVAWADTGAPAGDRHEAPAPRTWNPGWNISKPDLIVQMPKPVPIPAQGEIEYTYEIVPTHFAEDRWIQMSELRPGSPAHVHHAVVYIRPPDSDWLRNAPIAVPFTASTLNDPADRRQAHETTSDLLLVYAPGSSPDQWHEGMGKFVPAGSDLVFQMHYTTNGAVDQDQTAIGLVFARTPPAQRVITLQLNNHALIIPPGADDFRVQVQGTLPHDATLLSLFPHMHLRGKRFEYDIVHSDGTAEVLLRVNYHFHWQLSYKLAEPRSCGRSPGTTIPRIIRTIPIPTGRSPGATRLPTK
jgi:hypothetical protein